MATSMREVGARLLSRRFSGKLQTNLLSTAPQPFRTDPSATDVSKTVEYPPVKPKYPPGKWGKLVPKRAWKIHDEGQEILTKTQTVKFRLERLAGSYKNKHPFQFAMKMMDVQPGTLPFKQYVTKTHTIAGLPEELYGEVAVSKAFERLRPFVMDAIEHEADQYNFVVDKNIIRSGKRYHSAHRTLGRILNLALAGLSSSNTHLQRCQFDENVRVAAFWKRCGYESTVPHMCDSMRGILNFQYASHVNYQIRTELPLPEIVPMDDPICNLGEVPEYTYSPRVAGQPFGKNRPISIAGHWVGDPCEFGHLTAVVANTYYETILKNRGEKDLDEDSLAWGVSAGFANTVAQAHNQGFFQYADITYPFVNQVVVTDGQWIRFYVYQLNTLFLWKDNEGNPTRNLLWASPRMSLYDTLENGRVKGLNDDALKQLFKCLLVEPRERGVNMRPYIEHSAPANDEKYMNEIGEEPFPHYKPGRFEYPRNAVYF